MSNRIQPIVSARARETGGEIFAFNMSSNPALSFLSPPRQKSTSQKVTRMAHGYITANTPLFCAQILEFLNSHDVCLLGRFIKPEHYDDYHYDDSEAVKIAK